MTDEEIPQPLAKLLDALGVAAGELRARELGFRTGLPPTTAEMVDLRDAARAAVWAEVQRMLREARTLVPP